LFLLNFIHYTSPFSSCTVDTLYKRLAELMPRVAAAQPILQISDYFADAFCGETLVVGTAVGAAQDQWENIRISIRHQISVFCSEDVFVPKPREMGECGYFDPRIPVVRQPAPLSDDYSGMRILYSVSRIAGHGMFAGAR
jgi:hypothetical protein